MARAATGVAIEGKHPSLVRRELYHRAAPGKNRPGLYSKVQELETMGHVLREDANLDPLSLFDRDLGRAPSAALEGPRHKKDLPGPFMRRFAEIMRVENGQGKN